MYDEIAWGTRCKFESNRPRAILFEGPPGQPFFGNMKGVSLKTTVLINQNLIFACAICVCNRERVKFFPFDFSKS